MRLLQTPGKLLTILGLVTLTIVCPLTTPEAATPYQQFNLVSDGYVPAANLDKNLINPWGISYSPSSPFWVSTNNVTGVATLYNSSGAPQSLVVSIPPPLGGTPPSHPTGIVFNITAGFQVGGSKALFLFATKDGTISGWNAPLGTSSVLAVDNSAAPAVYTGLALGSTNGSDFLYAANFSTGHIDVFDSGFAPTTLSGSFSKPPPGYGPFNIQNLGGHLFVTYAQQDATGTTDVPGLGYGFVDKFDLNGNLESHLISGGALNSPWGLALAPASFGDFANTLLVANAGDGRINAFDPVTGAPLGTLLDSKGNPIVIEGLRGLIFGNGGSGGDPNVLYFTAGPGDQQHGLFGSLTPVPLPGAAWLLGSGLLGLAGLRLRKK